MIKINQTFVQIMIWYWPSLDFNYLKFTTALFVQCGGSEKPRYAYIQYWITVITLVLCSVG